MAELHNIAVNQAHQGGSAADKGGFVRAVVLLILYRRIHSQLPGVHGEGHLQGSGVEVHPIIGGKGQPIGGGAAVGHPGHDIGLVKGEAAGELGAPEAGGKAGQVATAELGAIGDGQLGGNHRGLCLGDGVALLDAAGEVALAGDGDLIGAGVLNRFRADGQVVVPGVEGQRPCLHFLGGGSLNFAGVHPGVRLQGHAGDGSRADGEAPGHHCRQLVVPGLGALDAGHLGGVGTRVGLGLGQGQGNAADTAAGGGVMALAIVGELGIAPGDGQDLGIDGDSVPGGEAVAVQAGGAGNRVGLNCVARSPAHIPVGQAAAAAGNGEVVPIPIPAQRRGIGALGVDRHAEGQRLAVAIGDGSRAGEQGVLQRHRAYRTAAEGIGIGAVEAIQPAAVLHSEGEALLQERDHAAAGADGAEGAAAELHGAALDGERSDLAAGELHRAAGDQDAFDALLALDGEIALRNGNGSRRVIQQGDGGLLIADGLQRLTQAAIEGFLLTHGHLYRHMDSAGAVALTVKAVGMGADGDGLGDGIVAAGLVCCLGTTVIISIGHKIAIGAAGEGDIPPGIVGGVQLRRVVALHRDALSQLDLVIDLAGAGRHGGGVQSAAHILVDPAVVGQGIALGHGQAGACGNVDALELLPLAGGQVPVEYRRSIDRGGVGAQLQQAAREIPDSIRNITCDEDAVAIGAFSNHNNRIGFYPTAGDGGSAANSFRLTGGFQSAAGDGDIAIDGSIICGSGCQAAALDGNVALDGIIIGGSGCQAAALDGDIAFDGIVIGGSSCQAAAGDGDVALDGIGISRTCRRLCRHRTPVHNHRVIDGNPGSLHLHHAAVEG